MKAVVDYIKGEPVRVFALLELIVGVLVALNLLSVEAGGGIISALALYLGVQVRSKVTPVATLPARIQEILSSGDTRTGEQFVYELFDGDV